MHNRPDSQVVSNLISTPIMNSEELLSRITINANVCHGKPAIRDLRYPVSSILEYLAAGDSVEDILTEFPDLEEEDIQACLAYAVLAVNARSGVIIPTAA